MPCLLRIMCFLGRRAEPGQKETTAEQPMARRAVRLLSPPSAVVLCRGSGRVGLFCP